jgi:hypothetical protein
MRQFELKIDAVKRKFGAAKVRKENNIRDINFATLAGSSRSLRLNKTFETVSKSHQFHK